MLRAITLKEFTTHYFLKRYKNSKHIRIFISDTGEISATAPKHISIKTIEVSIKNNAEWILVELAKKQHTKQFFTNRLTNEDFIKYKKHARKVITERVEALNSFYNFSYSAIHIRNQSSRWGSCSSSGTLSFNYKLLFVPSDQRDYVITHELCHLREMNHSEKFWKLVELTIPNYKSIRNELKNRHKTVT